MSETLTTTETASTDLAPEEQIAVGAGTEQPEIPSEPKEPEAPKSRREAIAAAADKLEKAEPEEGGKPLEQTPKPAKENPEPAAEDGKSQPEGGEKPTEEGKSEEEKAPEDGKQRQPPAPKRFLTKAKETWANTPNSVKAEVVRLERDYEELSQRATENEQYRESLRTFDEYAQRNGIKLSQALEVFTGIDQLLKQNPVQAVADILKTVGLTPQQYAQIVQTNSPQYQAQMLVPRQQAQPQAPQTSPREQELQQQLDRAQAARVNAEVIAPFAAAHPRFYELQETVVQCLNSGMIPNNLRARSAS
ncbi:hypothetical protein ACE4RV_02875 [Acetobacter persici]|uniref:hypothetical protein n=1 Tax=Acetobacter persici TaxID=1076596 RepID=UPI0036DB4D15